MHQDILKCAILNDTLNFMNFLIHLSVDESQHNSNIQTKLNQSQTLFFISQIQFEMQ